MTWPRVNSCHRSASLPGNEPLRHSHPCGSQASLLPDAAGTDIPSFREPVLSAPFSVLMAAGHVRCNSRSTGPLLHEPCIALLVPNNALRMRLKETRICSVIARIGSQGEQTGLSWRRIFPSARTREAFNFAGCRSLKKNSGMTQEVCIPAVSNSTQLILIRHWLLPAAG